ncbi:MAG TPA: alpha/beta hydrolase [Daejeonella sp.]|nr:alpha/beta hydrolase [Daejeonella sp.]
MTNKNNSKSGYSEVNGLKMYYELHGQGKPLVLIHGGGSTIQTSFGNAIPLLSKNRQIIAVELQAHGRTNDRNQSLSFEQDADDVVQLLKNIQINKADFLGFSNGGQTTIEIALRHPSMVNKIILASIIFKRSATPAQFWEGFEGATLNAMPQVLQEEFLAVNNDPVALQNMFNKDVQRMKGFKGWTDEQISSIKAPTLIMNGNLDVGSVEHAAEIHRLIPNSELVVLPGGHGQYLGTMESLENGQWKQQYTIHLIESFLDK